MGIPKTGLAKVVFFSRTTIHPSLPLGSHPALFPQSLLSGNEELGSSPRGDATGLGFDSFNPPLKCLVFKSIKRLSGVEKLGQDYINL